VLIAIKYLTATLPIISTWRTARQPALLCHSQANPLFAPGVWFYSIFTVMKVA
jgi:hypothetical protein